MLRDLFFTDLHLEMFSACLLAAWVVVAVVYVWLKIYDYNSIHKARKTADSTPEEHIVGRAPSISVVIALNGQRNVLADTLPAILNQEYPNFEVVVVDDGLSEEHAVTLQQLQQQYRNLRVSELPKTTLYISRKKLAITLGVRAAKGEWIVLTEPDSTPNSAHWLMNMASKMNADKDLVIGYSNYEDDGSPFSRRIRFERFMLESVYVRAVLRGRPLGGDGCNMAFRRDMFLAQKGFSGNVSLLRGEDVFLVDAFSREDNVAFLYDKVAAVTQKVGSKKSWKNEKISRMQAFRSLKRQSRRQLRRYDLSWGISLLYGILPLVYWAYGACLVYGQSNLMPRYVLDGIVLLLYILLPFVGLLTLNRSARGVEEKSFGLYPLYFEALRGSRRIYYEVMRYHNRRNLFRH